MDRTLGKPHEGWSGREQSVGLPVLLARAGEVGVRVASSRMNEFGQGTSEFRGDEDAGARVNRGGARGRPGGARANRRAAGL